MVAEIICNSCSRSDVARPMIVTTSWSPTYAKSSWTPKVNPFLYASPLPTLLNGMLLHTPSHMHDRFTPTSTEAREEARNIKPDKTEAWKRRRKKPRLNHRSLRPTPESPAYTGVSGPATPESPDRPPDRPQHPTRGQSVSPSGDDTGDDTGVSGLDRSLRPPTPESPACTMGLRAASWAFGPCTPLARPNPSFIPKLPLFMWMAYK